MQSKDYVVTPIKADGTLANAELSPINSPGKALSPFQLPSTDASFPAIMQQQDIQQRQSIFNPTALTPIDLMGETYKAANAKAKDSDKLSIFAAESRRSNKVDPDEERNSKQGGSNSESKEEAKKKFEDSLEEAIGSIDDTKDIIAQLQNLQSNYPEIQQKTLLAINEQMQSPTAVQKSNQLKAEMKSAYGDLSVEKANKHDPKFDTDKKNLLTQFLSYLTASQDNMNAIKKDMHSVTENLTPVQLLKLQSKFHTISSQIDFFANALGKVLENVKTLLNVQS